MLPDRSHVNSKHKRQKAHKAETPQRSLSRFLHLYCSSVYLSPHKRLRAQICRQPTCPTDLDRLYCTAMFSVPGDITACNIFW